MYIVDKKSHEAFKSFMKIKDFSNPLENDLYKKSKKYIRHTSWIPGLKMIAICNSLSMFATNKNSDIDLFIVTEKNRLWVVRFCITLYFFVLGQRKSGKNHAGKFCLSFFVDENALGFKKIAFKDDIYLFHWMLYLKPVLDFDETYKKFIQKNEAYFNLQDYKSTLKRNKRYICVSGKRKKENSFLGDILESCIRNTWGYLTLGHKKRLGNPEGIIVNKHMLKFHNADKRKELSNAFSQLVKK